MVDPTWVEAIGVWAIGFVTVVITYYQYQLAKSQAQLVKINKEVAETNKEVIRNYKVLLKSNAERISAKELKDYLKET